MNNMHTVIWFPVFLMQVICIQLYGFKYSYLIQVICTQLYGFKYSYLIQVICTQLYGFRYSHSFMEILEIENKTKISGKMVFRGESFELWKVWWWKTRGQIVRKCVCNTKHIKSRTEDWVARVLPTCVESLSTVNPIETSLSHTHIRILIHTLFLSLSPSLSFSLSLSLERNICAIIKRVTSPLETEHLLNQ